MSGKQLVLVYQLMFLLKKQQQNFNEQTQNPILTQIAFLKCPSKGTTQISSDGNVTLKK